MISTGVEKIRSLLLGITIIISYQEILSEAATKDLEFIKTLLQQQRKVFVF